MTYLSGEEINRRNSEAEGWEAERLKQAVEQSNRVQHVEYNFLGSGWSFVTAIGGNFWYHRASGKKLNSSSTWS